ncbi:MAG: inorganic phosphate transporter [Nitrospiraceae bacterium]
MEEFPLSVNALTTTKLAALEQTDARPLTAWWTSGLFIAVILGGGIYAASHLLADLTGIHSPVAFPFALLAMALLIALGFEFVNGFHDTANAVATVIYTNSLQPNIAVIWSGIFNFLGVLVSSGAVAYGIVSLLPVELILQVGNEAGTAMVFALLIAAMLWNIGTWYFGLPSSSSHTLIGSVIGVGLMNQLMTGSSGTSGVDWSQAANIGKSLLLSPFIGFTLAALLLLLTKFLIRTPGLYQAPKPNQPPPWWIRSILIFTCTGVSFAHGSNDGQKGMGLIMLILIGTVPTAYALNHAVSERDLVAFQQVSQQAVTVLERHDHTSSADIPDSSRQVLTDYLRTRAASTIMIPALKYLAGDIARNVAEYTSLAKVPADQVKNVRNDMYLVGESLRLLLKQDSLRLTPADQDVLKRYKSTLDQATKFIPTWVKVAVAIALGMGTMIGWKRIVVTVGEKIGKQHLSYAQGATAELVAMSTIGAAETLGLPVSTTHTLSSGVAGTMVANRSGLQWGTVRNILFTWVLTLPASIALSAVIFWLFRQIR